MILINIVAMNSSHFVELGSCENNTVLSKQMFVSCGLPVYLQQNCEDNTWWQPQNKFHV